MSKKANPPPPVPVRGAQVLLALGLAESALAIYQWSELLTLRGGGTTLCGISERINCETVWNSPFASAVHELARMPVAGLGLVWGIVAVALSALYLVWRAQRVHRAARHQRSAPDGRGRRGVQRSSSPPRARAPGRCVPRVWPPTD